MAGKYAKNIMPEEVIRKIAQGEPVNILDVRENQEWDAGHISGAKHIPLGSLGERHTELDKEQEYIVVCRSGNRSGLACELLEAKGYKVMNMRGGMSEWSADIE